MTYPLCRHIKTTGIQCGSPSLLGNRFCYYHARLHQRHDNYRPNPRLDPFFEPGRHIRLLAIEDRDSLMIAVSQTVNALATGQIELKHGKAILYGLQLAASSLRELEGRPEYAPQPAPMVHSVIPTNDHLDLAPPEPEAPTLEAKPAASRTQLE